MMKNMGYMPDMGLRKEGKGVVEFPNVKTQVTREGLGLFEGYDRIKKNLVTLNENFVKEGGNFPYCGFPEPWVGNDGRCTRVGKCSSIKSSPLRRSLPW